MNSSASSDEVPLPDSRDRLAIFLQKVAPILAAARGLNATSRLKLEAVAQDLGMSAAEFEEALRSAASAVSEPAPPPVLQDPQAEVFRIYLRKKLTKLVHGILTPDQEQRLIAIAWKRHTLAESEARQLIQEVSAELGQRQITVADAEVHVRSFIARQLSDVNWVDHPTAERFILAGQTWGLTAEHVDQLIREQIDINRRANARQDRWNRVAYTLAGMVLVLGVAFLGIWVLLRDKQTEAVPEKIAERASEDGQAAASKVSKPKWWDYDLAVAIARARVEVDGFGAVYDRLRSGDPVARASGYDQVLSLARRSQAGVHEELLRELVIGLHALEPDDKPAARLRDGLLALALVARRELPAGQSDYQLAFWSVRVALAGLDRTGLPESRGEALSALLERTLGVSIERRQATAERDRRCTAALAKLLFRQLTSGAAAQPKLALDLHSVLTRYAARCLEIDELEQLDVKFVVAALQGVEDDWLDYGELISRVLGSKDLANVLPFVDLLEKLGPGGLRDYLAGLLLTRADAKADIKDVASVAQAVRQALGVGSASAAVSSLDRWKQLTPSVRTALERTARPTDDSATLLRDLAELSHFATLACALAQDELGTAEFDVLWKEGVPKTAKSFRDSDDELPTRRGAKTATGPPAAPIVEMRRQEMDRYALQLKSYDRVPALQRPTIFRNLAGLAGSLDDIRPDHAGAIAHYLLGMKPKPEHDGLAESIPTVMRLKAVRLALADQLGTATLSKEELRQMLGGILGRNVAPEELASSRDSLRQELLRGVLLELPTESGPVMSDAARGDFDLAEETLRANYRIQAKLLGLDPGPLPSTSAVSDHLRLLIEQLANRPRPAKLSAPEQALLTQLPHELTASDYLAANDLQRTVLFQRLWLRLLAMEVAQRRPMSQEAVQKLVASQNERKPATHLVDQLRANAASELRLWMVCAPDGGLR